MNRSRSLLPYERSRGLARIVLAGLASLSSAATECLAQEGRAQLDCSLNRVDAWSVAIAEALKSRHFRLPRNVSFFHYGNRGPSRFCARCLFHGASRFQPHRESLGLDESIDLPSDPEIPPELLLQLPRNSPRWLMEAVAHSGPVPLRPTRNGTEVDVAKEYFVSMTSNHLNVGSEGTNWFHGRGLYASSTAVDSLGFSSENGFLLEVLVPAGVGALDLRSSYEQPRLRLSAEARAAAAEIASLDATCEGDQRRAANAQALRRSIEKDGFSWRQLVSGPRGRATAKAIYEKLDAPILIWTWSVATHSECQFRRGHSRKRGSMALFVHPGLADRLDFAIYSPQLEPRPELKKAASYARILSMLEAATRASGTTEAMRDFYVESWRKGLSLSPRADFKVDEYFGCSQDPRFAVERTTLDEP